MTITQIDAARQGIITDAMKRVAEKERKAPEEIRACVAAGTIAIPANINHKNLDPEGVGTGLRTKVNVNLGISGDLIDPEVELEKVRVALELGAEGIMDLSEPWQDPGVPQAAARDGSRYDRHGAHVRCDRLFREGAHLHHAAGLP